ncbi:MAG: amidohydrolase family protein [Bacteroidetes bacterium]|nr:amidohydrolase family protein [Bacteroidota bacterium]
MRFITSNRIFSGKDFLTDNTVVVLDNKGIIIDITTSDKLESVNIEHFEGIITPGFINTHCHLELSHLKGVIKQHTGIVDFGLGVIKHRHDASPEHQQEAMIQADKDMFQEGIVAVGDISNTNSSMTAKQLSNIHYHTFVELIALNPERSDLVFNTGKELLTEFKSNHLSASLAPHAPYSTSIELIEKITNDCFLAKQPSSIHNQESAAENEFFNTKSGDYIRLYESIGLPVTYFKATSKSSLQSIISAFNKGVPTLLVHNTFTNKNDIDIAQNQHPQLYWCLCPNANLYIENTLPDIALLVNNQCMLTLGTDSLASNSGLSIISEINTIQKHQPAISLELLLKAATYNGAQFLGLENQFGLIEINRKCGINLIEGHTGNYSVKKLA